MQYLVYTEHRPFSYLDFISFDTDGHKYRMAHGTFRNNISRLMKEGLVEVSCKSNLTFYSIKGVKFGNARRVAMTGNRMGVDYSSSNPLYRLLRDLPLGKNSIHNIRLRFTSSGIYAITASMIINHTLSYHYVVLPRSSDISFLVWPVRDLLIKVTIHKTDTVSVVIGCSDNPVTLDINGLVRLTNALSVVEERLSQLVEGSRGSRGFEVMVVADISFHDQRCRKLTKIIPAHSEWIVTMWHFGADASVEYTGEKFSVTWETAENVLIRAYSKAMNDDRTRIRLERQEYPKATLADIIEQKLSFDRRHA